MKIKNIFKIMILAAFSLILTACTNETKNVQAKQDVSNKAITIKVPIISNSGAVKLSYSENEIKSMFTSLQLEGASKDWSDNFSFENVKIEVPTGSYETKNKDTFINLDNAPVERIDLSKSSQMGLYFHEISIIYTNANIEHSALVERPIDVVLLNHYTGETEFFNLNTVDFNDEATTTWISQKLYEMNIAALQKDAIFEELAPIGSGDEPLEISREGYEHIVSNYKFDNNQRFDESYSSLEEFIDGKEGICNQFAYLYKLYLDYHDIENRLAFGNFKGIEGKVDHVWNEVKINGEWISVDTTGNGFGSEGTYENYFVSHYSSV